MDELFQDILEIKGVTGVMLLGLQGEPVYRKFNSPQSRELSKKNWAEFVEDLNPIQEAEVVFEHILVYIIKVTAGYLFVLMKRSAPIGLVRLNCNVLLPALNQPHDKPKGLGRFFKKRK
jgi:hypothetical protein